MPSQNTFGVRIDKKNVIVDERVSKYTKERLAAVMEEIDKHNINVENNPHKCQDVVELAQISRVASPRNITDITETLGLHARIPGETIDPHTEKRVFSTSPAQKIVQEFSNYWDKILKFEPQKTISSVED